MSKSSKTGSLLCSDEITDRLNHRSIFCHGSWDPENIRGAAYDLRMAEDVLIVPYHSDSKSLQSIRYNRGEKRPNRVILKPGDVAFVSTMEHFCMPWDLSGMLGSKFSLTSQGVLMLTGVCIDPGYGLALQNGRWVPKDDERLHFLLSNVGHDDVYLTPGKERIATIQFFKILAPAKKDSRIGGTEVAQKFFDPKTDQ